MSYQNLLSRPLLTSFESLDAFSRQVVDALCLLPDDTTVADLQELFGGDVPAADLEAALVQLAEQNTVVRDQDRLRLVRSLRTISFPAGLGPPLATLFGRQTIRNLEVIAHWIEVPAPKGKVALVAALTEALSSPSRVADLVAAGPPGTSELARKAAVGPPAVAVRAGLYGASDRTPHGWLLQRGLLAMTAWDAAVMPREVAVALRGGRVFPKVISRRPGLRPAPVEMTAVDSLSADRGLRLVRDLTALLEDAERTPLPLLKTGGVGVRELRRLAKLVGRDEPTTARLLELASASGLLGLSVPDTAMPLPAFDAWQAQGLAGRWGHLVAGWLAWDAQLFEAGAPDSRGRPVPALQVRQAEPLARERRRQVLAALRDAPGCGVDPAALAVALQWDAPRLWTSEARIAQGYTGWVLQEAELLGLASAGAISTAGRLATSGKLAEAVQDLGRFTPPVSDSFVLQADLTAMVAGEPAGAMRAELELLAVLESAGSASVYRFSDTSLRRGFDAGRSAEDIVSFLDGHATRGVPQALRYLVGDLGRRYGSVRAGAAGGYLRSDDVALLAEIMRSPVARRLGLRQLAPTVLVSPCGTEQLVEELRPAGWLAAAEGADGLLAVRRPPANRAVLVPELSRLRQRRPGTGRCFGPVDRVLAAVLADRPDEGEPAGAQGPVHGEIERMADTLYYESDHDAEPERPTWTASGDASVATLLELAVEQEWCVVLDDASGPGHVLCPIEFEDFVLYADCLQDGSFHSVPLQQINTARVLSEQQEADWE
ncbi:MAG: helicase-associated domain-containing protein [Actinobacteria bacterium]|nr:helicase-associated domain-containing protein [Actinomycetota bacterium]